MCDCHHVWEDIGWKTQINYQSQNLLMGERHYTTNDVRQAILSSGHRYTWIQMQYQQQNWTDAMTVSPFKQWPDEPNHLVEYVSPAGMILCFLDKEGHIQRKGNQRSYPCYIPCQPENRPGYVEIVLASNPNWGASTMSARRRDTILDNDVRLEQVKDNEKRSPALRVVPIQTRCKRWLRSALSIAVVRMGLITWHEYAT